MTPSPRRVAIVGGVRIPFARANTAYNEATNQQMLTATLKSLVSRFNLENQKVGEVAAGAVIKHSRDWNLARESTLGSGLHPETPAYDVQRACGTSLTAAVQVAHRIAAGEIECGIAGGVDSASDIPLTYGPELQKIVLTSVRGRSFLEKTQPWLDVRPGHFKPSAPGIAEPRTGLSMGQHAEETAKEWRIGRTAGERLSPWLSLRPGHLKPSAPGIAEPRTGLSMGQHAEETAKEWRIGRAEQDELAAASHRHAAAAWKGGFFEDLVVPFNDLRHDNNVRPDTSLEKLATLRTAFDRSSAGTLTAGNSSPLTDGAACVLLASEEFARARGFPILCFLTYSEAAAVDFVGMAGPKEGMLMAPAYAVPRMLDRAGLTLQDFDIYEIHEAFAAQVLCTLKAWESDGYCRTRLNRAGALGAIDRSKLNPKGSSVAIGHPFAATGARIVATLAKQLAERGSGRGLISICAAGGMGVTAILER